MTEPTRIRNTATRILKMQMAMAERPQSYDQLVEVSGLKKPAVQRWVKTMRAEGALHRAGWSGDKAGALRVPLFLWGDGVDAPRPGASLPPAERMARLRAKRKLEARA
jgi:hypothetical protein